MRTCGTVDVSSWVLPHACNKLEESAGEDCHPEDDVGVVDPCGVDIVHGQDECC